MWMPIHRYTPAWFFVARRDAGMFSNRGWQATDDGRLAIFVPLVPKLVDDQVMC
jgi:hypothetical protein